MHIVIAHHPLTDAQPVPSQLLPQFYCSAWRHIVWDIPLASWHQLFLFCSLSASCAPSRPQWQGNNRSWNVLGSVQFCSATTNTLVCYQHCFHPNSKTQHNDNSYEENWLYPNWNQDISKLLSFLKTLNNNWNEYLNIWNPNKALKEEEDFSVSKCYLITQFFTVWSMCGTDSIKSIPKEWIHMWMLQKIKIPVQRTRQISHIYAERESIGCAYIGINLFFSNLLWLGWTEIIEFSANKPEEFVLGMEALLFSATWHMLSLFIHKENSIDSIEEFLNVYSEAFEIIAKYVLKTYVLFHAC